MPMPTYALGGAVSSGSNRSFPVTLTDWDATKEPFAHQIEPESQPDASPWVIAGSLTGVYDISAINLMQARYGFDPESLLAQFGAPGTILNEWWESHNSRVTYRIGNTGDWYLDIGQAIGSAPVTPRSFAIELSNASVMANAFEEVPNVIPCQLGLFGWNLALPSLPEDGYFGTGFSETVPPTSPYHYNMDHQLAYSSVYDGQTGSTSGQGERMQQDLEVYENIQRLPDFDGFNNSGSTNKVSVTIFDHWNSGVFLTTIDVDMPYCIMPTPHAQFSGQWDESDLFFSSFNDEYFGYYYWMDPGESSPSTDIADWTRFKSTRITSGDGGTLTTFSHTKPAGKAAIAIISVRASYSDSGDEEFDSILNDFHVQLTMKRPIGFFNTQLSPYYRTPVPGLGLRIS